MQHLSLLLRAPMALFVGHEGVGRVLVLVLPCVICRVLPLLGGRPGWEHAAACKNACKAQCATNASTAWQRTVCLAASAAVLFVDTLST